MSQCPPTSGNGRIFRILFVALGLPLGVFAIFISDQRPPLMVGLVFVVVVTVGVWSWIHDRRQERRLVNMQAGRPALDASAFAEAFRDLKNGPQAAVAVRGLLEKHMGVSLSGLRPEDSVDAMRDYLDPIFFDELGEKLGFRVPTDYPEFSAMVTPLRTVRDLVEVVARKLDPA